MVVACRSGSSIGDGPIAGRDTAIGWMASARTRSDARGTGTGSTPTRPGRSSAGRTLVNDQTRGARRDPAPPSQRDPVAPDLAPRPVRDRRPRPDGPRLRRVPRRGRPALVADPPPGPD